MKPDIWAYMPFYALVVTVALIGGTIALAITGHDVPDEIKTGDALAFAWFFVSSAQRGTKPGDGGNG